MNSFHYSENERIRRENEEKLEKARLEEEMKLQQDKVKTPENSHLLIVLHVHRIYFNHTFIHRENVRVD